MPNQMDLEGIVSKRIGSRYVSGQTRAWLKTKNPDFQQLITSVSDGKKLGPAAAAVDKVDYACRKHDAYHASSNLRRRNANHVSECISNN
jgi:hypothetical protein